MIRVRKPYLTLKTYANVFTLIVICWYIHVNTFYGNACIVLYMQVTTVFCLI